MNSLIDLLDLALQANLSKRQWAAFAAVLRQTVGFRKVEDDLSARRLEQLTGIQRNHIWQAKKELEILGLLRSCPGQYGEVLSLVKPPETGYSPPKTGQPDSQIRIETLPKQALTSNNLTGSNHDTVVADDLIEQRLTEMSAAASAPSPESTELSAGNAVGLRYPPQLSTGERQQAPACLDGLSPQAAQQVLDVLACKIRNGEVRQSRIGLLVALAKAQRRHQLDTRCLGSRHPASPSPDNPLSHQQRLARERWLEQQAQQAWLRDMQHFGVVIPDLKSPVSCRLGGAP